MQFQSLLAWKFVHPDMNASSADFGIHIAANGNVAVATDREVIRQAIILLLSTIPGERIMRPRYGCNLQKLAFMPNDASTHGLAIHYVKSALVEWEPRIEIIDVDADCNLDNPSIVDITLNYRIRPLAQNEQLIVAYHIMGSDN